MLNRSISWCSCMRLSGIVQVTGPNALEIVVGMVVGFATAAAVNRISAYWTSRQRHVS